MAEIFALTATVVATLEQALKLFDRVRSAKTSYRELPDLVERHRGVVEATRSAVTFVRQEKALRTDNVKNVLQRIEGTSAELKKHLKGMARQLEKGGAIGFARQLFTNSEDAKKLEIIMVRLGRDKTDLAISLSLVNVGLTKTVEGAVGVNTAAVWRMNALLQSLLGEEGGLKLAELIKTKQGDSDGDDAEVVDLNDDDLMAMANAGRKVRIIQRNEAMKHALQINTPIGEDVWKDVDFLKIEDNKAHENAAQFNYPMDTATFLATLGLKYGQPGGGGGTS